MPSDPAIVATLISSAVAILAALITSVVGGFISFRLQRERLRSELKLEFATESAIRELLSDERWKLRSFDAIQNRFKGLDPNELRKFLVRSGAVSFTSGDDERWGLRERNADKL